MERSSIFSVFCAACKDVYLQHFLRFVRRSLKHARGSAMVQAMIKVLRDKQETKNACKTHKMHFKMQMLINLLVNCAVCAVCRIDEN